MNRLPAAKANLPEPPLGKVPHAPALTKTLFFGMFVLMAGISGYIGVRKVLEIGAFDIFRG
jgi:hypothetical protein